MAFPFSLSRAIVLSVMTVANGTSLVLSVIALHKQTAGVFQILAIFLSIFTLLTIIGCLCHQFMNRDEETSNTRNVGMFSFCGFFGLALAALLTVHARQGPGLCTDFANVASPCVAAGVQLGTAYVSSAFALIGFILSWIDKFPGAVKVLARYPTTKIPSSHFTPYVCDLDGNYTHPPVKVSSRPRNNSAWSDVPLQC